MTHNKTFYILVRVYFIHGVEYYYNVAVSDIKIDLYTTARNCQPTWEVVEGNNPPATKVEHYKIESKTNLIEK